MYAILFILLAYLIGSFPSALVLGKLTKGIDIREYGSKNLGSTNAIRVLGKKIGLFVFACDVFKGILVAGVARILYEACGFVFMGDFSIQSFSIFSPVYYGIAVVIGHCFPCFAKFKGGKAVATSLGITFALAPIPALVCLIVFLISLKISGYVSVSSVLATLTVVIGVYLQHFFFGKYFGNIDIPTLVFFTCIALFIIIRHRKNFVRLAHGTENSFKHKKETTNEEH